MIKRLPDGTIVNQYFKTTDAPVNGEDISDQGMRMLVGQVEKVHFVDDPSNVSKTFVEYDVSVRDAKGGQSVYRNVRKQDMLGGGNDFDETVIEPNEFAYSGKLDPSNFFKNKNGTMVLIDFTDGSKDRPVIVGVFQHPKRVGAKRTDGVRKKGEFRGVQWEINKDGELTITVVGNRGPDGKLKREGTGPTVLKIDKTGAVTLSDNKDQTFKMDRVSKTISFSNGTTITFDGENDKISMAMTGGSKVIVDGDADVITLETVGGAKAELDGASDKITLTAGELLSDNATEFTTTAPTVNLGSASPAEAAAIASKVETRLTAIENALATLSSLFATHTHLAGVVPVPDVPGTPFVAVPNIIASGTVKIEP